MAFGIYVHIPHCLQICPYCDFTKYELGKILSPEAYVNVLKREISERAADIGPRVVDTLYFGGGTPSLLEPKLILALLDELANHGFTLSQDHEFTIEINPGTMDETKLAAYQKLGVNRFSVGAQSFNERLLNVAGRKHSAKETVELLSLLKKQKVNFSFDLLFALPTQTLKELELDIVQALSFGPSHLSAYFLTVPEHHPLARNRAPDDEQAEMFELLNEKLPKAGLRRYEISSFAREGYESKHNNLYWTDQEFWGLGVSAHSYMKRGDWGTRFWNPTALPEYLRQMTTPPVESWALETSFPENQRETLAEHQALTDFCHVSLRMIRGLDENALRLKFNESVSRIVVEHLAALSKDGLVEQVKPYWRLTQKGRMLANLVFEKLTFLRDDLSSLLTSH
jgi:oxygen-independent coproporphyrinogen III oxidase